MRQHFYKGIKFKMTLVFSVTFIIISIIFSRYTYVYFKNSFVDNYNKYLFSRAQTLLDRTEINPDIIALPDSGESIRIFYHDYNRREKTVFQSPGNISLLKIPYKNSITDTLDLHGVYLKKDNYDGRAVEILFTVSNFALQKKLTHLAWLMFFSTLISGVISAIAIYMVSCWLLNPVKQIINQATQINTDKLSTRLHVKQTHDELQQLAETINAMLGRIEHEQELQNNFFAAASHELRTPLAILRAETELHLGNEHLPATIILLNSQLQEIDRLQQIVQQFLMISQLKHGGLKLYSTNVDLTEQLLKVFTRNHLLLQQNNLQPSIVFDENVSSYFIEADQYKLEMIWQNLLQNAIKYAAKNSIISCVVNQVGDQICIVFENEIADFQISTDKLGTAFYNPSNINAGSGLGLWLCKQLAVLHQGEIQFFSNNYKFTVKVYLPIKHIS